MFLAFVIVHSTLPLPDFLAAFILALVTGIVALATSVPLPRGGMAEGKEWAVLRMIGSMAARPAHLGEGLARSLGGMLEVLGMDAGAIRLNTAANAPSLFVSQGLGSEVVAELEAALEGAEPRLPHDRTVHTEDLESPGDRSLLLALKAAGFEYIACHPVISADKFLGTFTVTGIAPPKDNKSQEAFTGTLVEILGNAIDGARLREQSHKLEEDLFALHEVNKIISQSFDLEDIIRRIVIEGRRLVKTRHCHLFLREERQQRLIGSASTQEEDLNIREVEIKLSEDSPAVQALLQKRVIAIENIPHNDSAGGDTMQAIRCRSAIFAPLIAKEEAVGVLICGNETAQRSFAVEEISRAETLAHQAAIALENARLFQVVSRSQKEWETTFDAMQDCVSVHDPSGKIIRANVALARHLKTSPPHMIGKYCSEVYNPDQLSFSPCRHMEPLQTEHLVVEEVDLRSLGGVFQISVSPWYDKNNRLIGSIHVAKDVSNEKLLRQQLIQSEKLSAIGELISGIAHELNNPLTGVMGYSQLLQLRKDLDERARETLLKINNLALRCQKIVQNLLSFARKQKPERTLSNVNDMLERTVELRNYELSVNNIEIVRELERTLPKTIADAHQLQQVFLNVITNAEHAMLQAHGRGRLVIRSRADMQNNRIVVEIIDDGPGIPESQLSKIFDPFFTTKEVGKGTGLGLSLSYGIIKEHGGNIYARSRVGEGTSFVIELPIISQLSDDASIFPQLMPQALEFDNLVRDKRVLIVDDEKYILDFFTEVFKLFPMRVDTASDGRAAMEKLTRNDYDLVITDFKMPQMSGRDLYQWIKDKRPRLAQRIIFITGDTVSTETRSFFENNCNLYLAKPFKIEEVKEAIQQTFENVG